MDWDEVLGRLEGMVDLEETARATGALRRVRKVRRASDLLRLALVDGSVICGPGSQRPDWRVHARYDPAAGQFVDLAVSTGRVAEGLEHTALEAGTILVVDRGYGRAEQIRAVLAAGCGFVSRIGWRSLSLRPAETQGRFDLMAHLPQGDAPVEHQVRLRGQPETLRLITWQGRACSTTPAPCWYSAWRWPPRPRAALP